MGGAVRGILLCGGLASRFGTDKLLAAPGPVVADAARHLQQAVGRALAVIPLGKRALREALEAEGCEVLETDRTLRGMSGSLAAGVEAAGSADGWIVALGDMPRVRPRTIRAVADALLHGATIGLPMDGAGRRGHPVGFAASLRAELLALEGDVGARSLLARHAGAIHPVVTDDPGIFIDIDTPADLAALQPKGQTS